ncbi:efflux RND transporter periplasmic adaptor subunit [Hyphomicrobium sp. MC8b]|jgi:RND family efflux transporter MFP subunit|uniref:efflux RND transporter periplasmic adaptor subunit n=1 Tax=unclassified Hyphomicrobium TaxID=2619925 RepID=UPI00391C26E8
MMDGLLWSRTLGTLVLVALTLAGLQALWQRYQIDPITRDGKVRADVVQVATDVSGLVTQVCVQDNEFVRRGQVLLVMDRPRYELALQRATATLASAEAMLAQAEREDRRNRSMSTLIAAEKIEQGSARVDELRGRVAEAASARDLAKLNLDRTYVRAPVDGYVSNMTLQPGVYMKAGEAVAALVYAKSMRIEGYFEETKVPAIHVGDPAVAFLMGVGEPVRGHVESIASGIADRERSDSESALANVNPSFSWVRLAQRIPVRIAIDEIPSGLKLIVGQTATVEVKPRPGEPTVKRSFPW